ncbi:MAG: hypothetical protein BWY76_02306 [bacterium ADurb.Bin429]|nr:MAG: hypothetical protein BWY76_02306 [bacterium ADurb.Bin429]
MGDLLLSAFLRGDINDDALHIGWLPGIAGHDYANVAHPVQHVILGKDAIFDGAGGSGRDRFVDGGEYAR